MKSTGAAVAERLEVDRPFPPPSDFRRSAVLSLLFLFSPDSTQTSC